MGIWSALACLVGSLKIMNRVTKIKPKSLIFSCFFPLLCIHTRGHYEWLSLRGSAMERLKKQGPYEHSVYLTWALRTSSLDIVLWNTEEWNESEKLLRNGDSTCKLWGKLSFPWLANFLCKVPLWTRRPIILFQRTLQLTGTFLAVSEQCPVFSSVSNRLPVLGIGTCHLTPPCLAMLFIFRMVDKTETKGPI